METNMAQIPTLLSLSVSTGCFSQPRRWGVRLASCGLPDAFSSATLQGPRGWVPEGGHAGKTARFCLHFPLDLMFASIIVPSSAHLKSANPRSTTVRRVLLLSHFADEEIKVEEVQWLVCGPTAGRQQRPGFNPRRSMPKAKGLNSQPFCLLGTHNMNVC